MLNIKMAGAALLFLAAACGDVYRYETESEYKIGGGVGGEYFARFKKILDTCAEKAPEGVLGAESPDEEMFYILVLPKTADERLVDIVFCEDTCEFPQNIWSDLSLNDRNQFTQFIDLEWGQKAKRYGAFAGNRMGIKVIVESAIFYANSAGEIYKKDLCEIVFYGVAEKVADYVIPVFGETEKGGEK